MTMLKKECFALSLSERIRNAEQFLLLGHPDAYVKMETEAGDAKIIVSQLIARFNKTTTWTVLNSIQQDLEKINEQALADALQDALTIFQERYKMNSQPLAAQDPIKFPKLEFQEGLFTYLENNLHMRKDPDLSERDSKDLLREVYELTALINDTFLHPIDISEIDDATQKEIIEDLRISERDIFFVNENDGKTYLHGAQWIQRNLRERKIAMEVNMSGDISSRLDGVFNNIFKYVLRKKIHAIISEEDHSIIYGLDAKAEIQNSNPYRVVLFLDPIDGSSQVENSGTYGSIIKIGYLKPGQKLETGDYETRAQNILGYQLQYGPNTMMTLHNGVNKLGKGEIVHFQLTDKDNDVIDSGQNKYNFRKVLISAPFLQDEIQRNDWDGLNPLAGKNPKKSLYLALGGSLPDSMPNDGYASYLMSLIKEYGYIGTYTGTLLNDILRLMLSKYVSPDSTGVMYAYRASISRKGAGRLRYPFEGIYIADMFSALGLEVIDGVQPLVNTQIEGEAPSNITVPFMAMSAWMAKKQMAWDYYLKTNKIEQKQKDKYDAWLTFESYYKKQSKRLI
jgi:fructose-1,6-bisphosphatase